MSYTPSTWATNDVVTSAKLNNIEQGISVIENTSLGNLIVNCSWDDNLYTYKLDQTLGSIVEAIDSGRIVQVNNWYNHWDSSINDYVPKIDLISLVTAFTGFLDLNDDTAIKEICTADGNIYYAYSLNDYPLMET